MSEQNILNPAVTSALNPDYAVKVTDPAVIARWQARSGKPFFRQLAARGPVWDLQWGNRMFSDADALVQWFHQYEKDFFSYADWDTGRYYSGMFADQPVIERVGNQRVNISAQFVVVPGLNLFQYPSRWGTDSIFIEEQDGYGNDLPKYTGTWTIHNADGNAHGGFNSFSSTTNDIAEIIYFGYGLRYWSQKGNFQGIVEISLDGSVLGTVDLYSAATVPSAALFTQQNVKLGQHRVKLRVTGTKNVASTGFTCLYDAIEVMR